MIYSGSDSACKLLNDCPAQGVRMSDMNRLRKYLAGQ